MNSKKIIKKHLRSGLYCALTSSNFRGLNLSHLYDPVNDNNGVLLLNVRSIPSSENLCREFYKVPEVSSSSDEVFCSSINYRSSTNNCQRHLDIKDSVQLKDKEEMQGLMPMIQSNSFNFNPHNSDTDNHLSAIRAAITGDIRQLQYLINVLKVSVNAAYSQDITLLHWATANDKIAVVQLLLKLGADFRLITAKGYSVLHTAVCNDAANCLKLFLRIFFKRRKTNSMKRNSSRASSKFLLKRDCNGNSLLHLACRLRKKRCLKIVLSFIMKYFGWVMVEEMLQQCNQDNETPIHVACFWNSVGAVNLLLTDSLKQVVNRSHNSAKATKVAVVLKEASRRTLSWQITRGTVLHEMAAVKCNSTCCTKNSPLLLEYDKLMGEEKMHLIDGCITTEISEKICRECHKARLKVVRVILKCCPEMVLLRDMSGQTPLMCSVISDAISLTKALLSFKKGKEQWLSMQLISIDPDFHTTLHYAAAAGKLYQVTLLLESGASVGGQDSYGATPMHYAAIRGFCSILQLLYEANKYTDEVRAYNGHSAFMWAAMTGMDISIRAMIDLNPKISQKDCDNQGCTALHLAAVGDHVEVISTLLLFKWNTEKRNKFGETPLVMAAKNGSAKAVRCLLHAGADYSSQDRFNNTALHLAADSDGKKDTVLQLLYYIKDSSLLNKRNDMGQTPLHYATEHNAVQCVRYLLNCGADPLIKDYRGWDPLMIAIEQGCWSTIVLILKNSSNINCRSVVDNIATLSSALKKKNYILTSFLETNGARTVSEIQDIAARIIQRWYRAQHASRYQ